MESSGLTARAGTARAFLVHLCNGWILLIGLDELELLDESRYWSLNSILYI